MCTSVWLCLSATCGDVKQFSFRDLSAVHMCTQMAGDKRDFRSQNIQKYKYKYKYKYANKIKGILKVNIQIQIHIQVHKWDKRDFKSQNTNTNTNTSTQMR